MDLKSCLRYSSLPDIMLNLQGTESISQHPPSGHKSHKNVLGVRPETWRRLENVYSLKEAAMDQTITSWIDTNIPEGSFDLRQNPFEVTSKPTSIAGMISWLENSPLQMVQNIMHILYPRLREWGFTLANDGSGDEHIFQYFTWSTAVLDSGRNSVVIAFQPPWILSEQDIREFAECRSFPPFRKSGNAFPISLQSKERLWAKIWDTCVRTRTHWFVLTSYDNWVFGAFSTGWTAAFVTAVYTFDMYNPTIAECLTFWTVAAMRIPGSSSVPKVPEPLAHHMLPAIASHVEVGTPTPANSESNWEGKSDDFGSSAGVESTLSETTSDDAGLMGRLSWSSAEIWNWMADARSNGQAPPDRATVTSSCPSVDALELPNLRLGDWLA